MLGIDVHEVGLKPSRAADFDDDDTIMKEMIVV